MKKFISKLQKNSILNSFFSIKPNKYIDNKRIKFSELLSYEDVIEIDSRSIFILQPTAVCCGWELEGIFHELDDIEVLETKISNIMNSFNSINNENITIQLITDRGKDNLPKCHQLISEPKNISQKICKHQFEYLSNKYSKIMKTEIYLFLRLEIGINNNLDLKLSDDFEYFYNEQINIISDALDEIEINCEIIEKSIEKYMKYTAINADKLKLFLKKWTHSSTDYIKDETQNFIKYNSNISFKEQISENYIEFSPNAVKLNNQIIQAISCKNIPIDPKIKSFINLLSVEHDTLICVSMLPSKPEASQYLKKVFLEKKKDSSDLELDELNYLFNESKKKITLWDTSIHVLIRHDEDDKIDFDSVKNDKTIRKLCQSLFTATKATWIEEKDNFPAVYLSCLPFMQNRYLMKFIGRNFQVLNKDFPPFFLVYSSFRGTGIEKGGMLHINRAGELIYLNSRIYEGEFNMHSMTYGPGGSGKSVLHVYDILCDVAYNNSFVFIIDSQTSGEILARVLAFNSKSNVLIFKPPHQFPNPFSGEIDDERSKAIASIISSSLWLLTRESLNPKESSLLNKTILYAYNLVKISSQSVFTIDNNSDFESIEFSKIYIDAKKDRRSLRMQDIINSLAEVAAINKESESIVFSLKDKLSPFYDSGQFSNIFDQITYEKSDEETPCVIIYDLCELQNQQVLLTVTTQVLINEIMRHIYRNKGRKGYLMIDEAGQNLGGSNESLAAFIEIAFAIFRKKGVKCVGIDNDVSRFVTERALKAMWDASDTKMLLPTDITTAEKFVRGPTDSTGKKTPLIVGSDRYTKLLPSLEKKSGIFADILFHGKFHKGTFTFAPCGHLYWLSVNKDIEKETFYEAVNILGNINDEESVLVALDWLAENYPSGKKNEIGEPIRLNDCDKEKLSNSKKISKEIIRKGAYASFDSKIENFVDISPKEISRDSNLVI